MRKDCVGVLIKDEKLMKLLIADTKFPVGHRNLNKHLLYILLRLKNIDALKVFNSHAPQNTL